MSTWIWEPCVQLTRYTQRKKPAAAAKKSVCAGQTHTNSIIGCFAAAAASGACKFSAKTRVYANINAEQNIFHQSSRRLKGFNQKLYRNRELVLSLGLN
jgi:hypothetical protein